MKPWDAIPCERTKKGEGGTGEDYQKKKRKGEEPEKRREHRYEGQISYQGGKKISRRT